MIISFTNVIGAIRNVGKSIITSGLKMWLGFQTSEPLGRELVVNGDFSDGEAGWTFGGEWSVNAQNQATTQGVSQTAIYQAVLVNGTNRLTFNVESGGAFVYTNYPIFSKKGTFSTEGLHTIDLESDGVGSNNLLYIYNNGAGNPATIDNISVKELTQITPDLSGNSNVGQLFTGKALDFNGSTDSVDIDGFQLAGSDATFAFWINPSQAQNKYILDVNITRFVIGFASLELSIFSGGSFFNFGAITSSEWSRVAIVINGTSASCYVNGVQLGTTKTITAISIGSATLASIGSVFTGASTNYDGKLSDFQIYNAVWSADDIAYDYAKPNHLVTDNPSTSLTASNLKAYWALTEGAGSIAYDSSGGGIDGAISGASYTEHESKILQLGMVDYSISTPVSDEVTLVANPSNPSQDILGNSVRLREHAFNLDGSGYAEVADDVSLNFGTGAFTMECWVKADFEDTGNNLNVVLSLGFNVSGSATAGIVTHSNNKLGGYVVNQGIIADNTYTQGDWYHVVVTRNVSGLCTLYIDSEAQADTKTTTATVTNADKNKIGRDLQTTRYYKNLISDVRLYDRALLATEVENNYNVGLPAHSAGSSFSDDFSSDYGN